MALTESQRLEVFESYRNLHGEYIAGLLMSTIPPFDWIDVATKDDLAQLEERLDARMAQSHAELEAGLTKTLYTALIASNAALGAVLALVVTLVAVLV